MMLLKEAQWFWMCGKVSVPPPLSSILVVDFFSKILLTKGDEHTTGKLESRTARIGSAPALAASAGALRGSALHVCMASAAPAPTPA